MARIVYGVSGEGSGHASRARVIAKHLIEQGHQVKMVSYDRGFRNLVGDFEVYETEGLNIAGEDNQVSKVKTIIENLVKLPEGGRKLKALRHEIFKTFKPHCVITDFEPMTAYLAWHYGLPLISLDNQHAMRYLDYDCPESLKRDRLITQGVIKALVPNPHVSIITSFIMGKPKNNHTFVFPPILKAEVLGAKPELGNAVLVYLTSGFETFLELLKGFSREQFLVYGYDREQRNGPLHFRPFSRHGFLKDLSQCKAVMATAGFTLMGEAFHLGKPYLALPMKGQFEQELNAFYIQQLGYGKCVRQASVDAIGDFLYRLPDYRDALQSYVSSDSRELKSKLDKLLECNLKLLKEFVD